MASKVVHEVAAKCFFLSSVCVPSGLGLYGFYKYRRWSMVSSIDASLEYGTRPRLLTSVAAVDRSELEEDIRRKFIDVEKDTPRFGVIMGPNGTGKMFILRRACCKEPTSGVLYFKVGEPRSFATDLADAVRLQWKPGFWDTVFEYIFPTGHLTYYKMPDGISAGVSFVLDVLHERAVNFYLKNDRSPVLFLDCVDRLAKGDREAFINLVHHCRIHSSSGKLRIVLVSDGNVMPFIQNMRRAKMIVMEVFDLDDKEASQYLVKCGMEEGLSKRVVEFIGGRFFHLEGAIGFMKDAQQANPQITENELYNEIKKNMINTIAPRVGLAKAAGKEKQSVLKYLFDHDPFYLNELMTGDSKWNDQVSETVDTLIQYRLLRYNRDAKVTWHSRLVKNAVTEAFLTK